MPAPTDAAFSDAMSRLTDGLSGPVGVAVRDLATGQAWGWNAGETFPTASTLKVPLLYEVYREAAAGRLDLDERVTLGDADRVPGSGVLQHMDTGLAPTLRDLAELMIIVSDNQATDMLYHRLGRERIAAMLVELGLHDTHLPMTIRELFSALVGVDPADPSVTYAALRDRLRDHRPGDADGDNPALAMDARNDVSTPADMVRLLALIHEGHGLVADHRDRIMTTLRHQNFTFVIPFRLPQDIGIQVAHKTGSLRGVRNDVGIVEGPGATYAIALMSRGQDDIPEVYDRLSRISRWVWDALGGPAPAAG